jgi:serine/threonine-protein kinase
MREAVLDGAKGIGPDEDATSIAQADQTSATTVLPSETGPLVVPRAPRSPRRAAPAPEPAPAYPEQLPRRRGRRDEPVAAPARRAKRRRGAFRRMLTTLVLLLVLAGAAAAAYVATSTSSNSVQLRRVAYDQANQVVDQLTQLINDNTR